MPRARTVLSTNNKNRAFTIMELVMVIAIIVIVISIVLPAIGGARQAARKAETQRMITDLVSASSRFEIENRRFPGHFSASEMGDPENLNRGFVETQNVLLDLAGGIVPAGSTVSGTLMIGPKASTEVEAHVDNIGLKTADNDIYFNPPKSKLKTGVGIVSTGDNADWPVLVDSWGTPIMLWVANEASSGPITTKTEFVSENWVANQPSARYYAAANAGIWMSTGLGDLQKSQAIGTNDEYSLLTGMNANERQDSLMGLLGDPTSPNDTTNPVNMLPTQPKNSFLAVSAGRDGVFFSAKSKRLGGIIAGSDTPALHYKRGLFTGDTAASRRVDEKMNPTSIDILRVFDDLVVTSGK